VVLEQNHELIDFPLPLKGWLHVEIDRPPPEDDDPPPYPTFDDAIVLAAPKTIESKQAET
jgi:hypothetical protein